MSKRIIIALITAVATFTMCKKLYTPELSDQDQNVLVIEGTINVGDSTFIKLSRTVPATSVSNANARPELNAEVTIEDEGNVRYPLKALGNGRYATAQVAISQDRKYRLRVKTSDGQVYLSDAEAPKITPPIDSVGFDILGDGIRIYANAHDDNNKTTYYRWDYEEAWRFHSKYDSFYETDGTKIVNRKQHVYYCFSNAVSSTVIIASTAGQTKDVIYRSQISNIPSESEKISVRYSILLKQYAISQKAYEFWNNMKKNTETIGSIFDGQPAMSTGNIHCITDPERQAIGFISISTVQSKRIFIDRKQLPAVWKTKYPYDCTLDSIYFVHPISKQQMVDELLIPPGHFYTPVDEMGSMGYWGSTNICVDCTLRGTLKQPAFWKE